MPSFSYMLKTSSAKFGVPIAERTIARRPMYAPSYCSTELSLLKSCKFGLFIDGESSIAETGDEMFRREGCWEEMEDRGCPFTARVSISALCGHSLSWSSPQCGFAEPDVRTSRSIATAV